MPCQHQSYDVLYDDGDVSKKIQRLHHLLFIKTKCLPQQKSSPPVGKDPMWIVGTKVKAKRDGLYGLGKGDWHQGTILASYVNNWRVCTHFACRTRSIAPIILHLMQTIPPPSSPIDADTRMVPMISSTMTASMTRKRHLTPISARGMQSKMVRLEVMNDCQCVTLQDKP